MLHLDRNADLISSAVEDPTVTITTIVTPSPSPPPTPPAPVAECKYWNDGFFYIYLISRIDGWATDGGISLKQQEKGCGAITNWQWVSPNPPTLAYVSFNMPLLIKSNCVERAVASAGGPSGINCAYEGVWDGSFDG